MLVKNNWLSENLMDRITDSDAEDYFDVKARDFNVTLSPYNFKAKDFNTAVDEACKDIAGNHSDLYLAYSGGLDSEFVLRAFHRNGIKITPVIVCCGNEHENEYAYETCEELGIDYIKVEVTEDAFFKWYASAIRAPFNGIGFNATQLIFAADVVNKRGGTLITGDNILLDGDNYIEDSHYAWMSEWDFYADHNYKDLNIIPFFLYTPDLTYSMLPEEYGFWNDYKAKLYGIPNRRKLTALYSDDLMYKLNMLIQLLPDSKRTHYWSKSEILDIFNKVKE
jgi:hypothetical protein